jgi:Uma2 family endonuclease
MPTTVTREQGRWKDIVNDPLLSDLPYKVETNAQGQIILSPHENRHSFLQKAVQDLLDEHVEGGVAPPEFAIATPKGVKTPDVVWTSFERRKEMEATGDPTTLAPEICVEVLSASNTVDEMEEKRRLYRAAGADEIWIVERDGRIRFFSDEELAQSEIAPSFPTHV